MPVGRRRRSLLQHRLSRAVTTRTRLPFHTLLWQVLTVGILASYHGILQVQISSFCGGSRPTIARPLPPCFSPRGLRSLARQAVRRKTGKLQTPNQACSVGTRRPIRARQRTSPMTYDGRPSRVPASQRCTCFLPCASPQKSFRAHLSDFSSPLQILRQTASSLLLGIP
jgi:hypothetical protein